MQFDRRLFLLAAAPFALTAGSNALAQPVAPLRVVWLQGNPVQARVTADGRPQGPAIDMAEAISKRLNRPLQVTAVAGPEAVLNRVRNGEADLAFIAFDPARAAGLAFTPPYLLSLNRYAVLTGSTITAGEQVDRAGVRLAAIMTDSGGLHLQRTIRNATFVPVASVDAGLQTMQAGGCDVVAGNAQRLADHPAAKSIRLLPGHFYDVPQSIAVREGQTALLEACVAAVAEARASGALTASIRRWNLVGAAAAPP